MRSMAWYIVQTWELAKVVAFCVAVVIAADHFQPGAFP